MSTASRTISTFRKSGASLEEVRSHEQHCRTVADNNTQMLHSAPAWRALLVVPFHRNSSTKYTSMQMQGRSFSTGPGVNFLRNTFLNFCGFTFLALLGVFLIMLLIIFAVVAIGFYVAVGSHNLSSRALRIGYVRAAKIGKLLRCTLSMISIRIKRSLLKLRSRTKR